MGQGRWWEWNADNITSSSVSHLSSLACVHAGRTLNRMRPSGRPLPSLISHMPVSPLLVSPSGVQIVKSDAAFRKAAAHAATAHEAALYKQVRGCVRQLAGMCGHMQTWCEQVGAGQGLDQDSRLNNCAGAGEALGGTEMSKNESVIVLSCGIAGDEQAGL